MNNSSLLSIIIPSRNRQKYVISAITSILSIPALDLELVVQDNSDSRDLEEYILNNVKDARLRYNYTSIPLSFIDNFNASVKIASGKYLCIIGDDDGVNPEIVEAVRWMDANDIDALKPTVSVVYLWPESGVPSTIFRRVSSRGLVIINPFSQRITKPDSQLEMKRVVRGGGLKYLETEIPRLYHGIVKRECLDMVHEKTGAFFGGLTPDIFIALAVANFTKNVVSIDYPLTIAGVCKSSGSAQSVRGEHTGDLKDAPHFKHRGAYEWSDIVPRFYSVETIWADSTIAALRALGRDDILKDFNLPILAAHCVVAHPKYRHIILRDMYKSFRITNKNWLVGTIQFCYSLLTGPIWQLFIKVKVKAMRIMFFRNRVEKISNVKNIVEATDTLTHYLRKNKKRFSDLVGTDFYKMGDKKEE